MIYKLIDNREIVIININTRVELHENGEIDLFAHK